MMKGSQRRVQRTPGEWRTCWGTTVWPLGPRDREHPWERQLGWAVPSQAQGTPELPTPLSKDHNMNSEPDRSEIKG